MKKELAEYLNGERNVIKDEFILGREKVKNSELIFVSVPGCDDPLYTLFNAKKKRKYKVKAVEGEEIARIEKVLPKGTGGEPAYVTLILNELEKYTGLSLEASGLVLKLFSCLEWNTCRIIRKRDKKPMTRDMIDKQFGIGIKKLKNLISELSAVNIICYKNKAYYLNQSLVRKGMGL